MVAWEGTQHATGHESYSDGENYNGATLAVTGDMKSMNPRYIRAAIFEKYGVTMYVGIGIPIPVLDEDMMYKLSRPNREIWTDILDYSDGRLARPNLGRINYQQLRSGRVQINGKTVISAPISSLVMAREIAQLLKDSIDKGEFLLQQPIRNLPTNSIMKRMPIRKVD